MARSVLQVSTAGKLAAAPYTHAPTATKPVAKPEGNELQSPIVHGLITDMEACCIDFKVLFCLAALYSICIRLDNIYA